YNAGTPDAMIRPRELLIGQNSGPSALPADAQPGDGRLVHGFGRIGADRIRAGGFDDVSLMARDLLTFDGDVDLGARCSLSLLQGALGNTTAGASVRLAAPYVLLGGRTVLTPDVALPVSATLDNWTASRQPGASLLRVDAEQIDIRNFVRSGMYGEVKLNGGVSQIVDRRGYEQVALRSRGDLRFLPASAKAAVPIGGLGDQVSAIMTNGDLLLSAQRIYPATGSVGLAVAGYLSPSAYDPARTLRVERIDGPLTAAAPLSVFGTLMLIAPTVAQGGALYAPLGRIHLGAPREDITRSVRLLPGSLTSVSAKGLTIPYGGTVDGLSYQYDGTPILAISPGGKAATGSMIYGVTLEGQSFKVDPGAVIDLSGGGLLTGAAFISGRGGSTDPLYHPLPRFNQASGTFELPALAANPVYAILPGLADRYAPVTPQDSASGYAGTRPQAGETITIGAGVPGLAAGTYTLLPSYYALLPGAFRVELGADNPLAFAPLGLRGGSWTVAGTRGLGYAGTGDAVPRQVLVTPGDVLRRHAQYNEMDYQSYTLANAARTGKPRAMLPADTANMELIFR
ncbi:MAG: hemagglutinin, partial [Achromobacter sp.]|nr:hemagglutinin [Achromobacter sp.]